MKYIDDLEAEDLKGTRVLLRLDLNAPVINGEVTDAYRLERVVETVDYLRSKEAKVIIISHCEGKESKTLVPMWHYLNGYFPVQFCTTFFTPESIDKLLNLEEKGVLLFENLRLNPKEEENDLEFSKKLSAMADIYVNDAFSVSHRNHASIVGIPKFLPHFGGLIMRQEIEHLSRVFKPEHPFVFIIGGAKFETKLPLIKKYLEKADKVFVGGALANDIYKEKGFEVGTSLVSKGNSEIADIAKNPKIIVCSDVTVKNKTGTVEFKAADKVLENECIVDAGPETLVELKSLLQDAKTIVWNGPLGNYEIGFQDKTESLAEIIAEATKNGAESIVGGGDTIASINKLGINHKFSFISTGGGAMLDFLVNETLPGIEALKS
ncbi:phosphoglycerate kinase [Patescibacteria group bacterium]|nr:phosphoglycerate kinase [Patescibacteria group bacterium]